MRWWGSGDHPSYGSVINLVEPEPSGSRHTSHTKKRGPLAKFPEKGSGDYSTILGCAAQFALEINPNLSSGKTIWSYGMKEAARKQLADRCLTGQFADTFKRPDCTFYSEAQIWQILDDSVQSWQNASVTRGKTGDANEPIFPNGHILEQLVVAKKIAAVKLSAIAEVNTKNKSTILCV
jgi:hypothetical protein